jgi:hypothetical protein
MITEPKTIIYRINLFNIKGKKNAAKSSIKKFFSKLYEQQKTFLQKVEVNNQEYKKIYKIDTKAEKPKINYSNFFDQIFKDVNPPNKIKRNKLIVSKLQKIISNNSNKKIKSNNNNKNIFNNGFKTFDTLKKHKNICYSTKKIKNQKKYVISSISKSKRSRNEEEKNMPKYNTLNTYNYNSLSAPPKSKNQKQKMIFPQNSKFSIFNDNIINNKAKSNFFGKESEKSSDFSFPRLIKNNSTNNNNKIFSYKIHNSKSTKFKKSAEKCIYDSGDFQIPFVTLASNINDFKNLMKMKNLTHYSKLKKLILEKHFLC